MRFLKESRQQEWLDLYLKAPKFNIYNWGKFLQALSGYRKQPKRRVRNGGTASR